MPKFEGEVTAEQHALDNHRHRVLVLYSVGVLSLSCQDCDWWDEQLFDYKEG